MTATGSGDAFDAAVDTTGDAPTEDPRIALQAAVDAAERKVDKLRAHLEGAEQAVAEARAALEEGSS